MSIYKATSQFVESSNYLTTKELHDNFINLTLARHGLDETSDAYKVLSEKTEEARNLLLKRRHKDARRKGW